MQAWYVLKYFVVLRSAQTYSSLNLSIKIVMENNVVASIDYTDWLQ